MTYSVVLLCGILVDLHARHMCVCVCGGGGVHGGGFVVLSTQIDCVPVSKTLFRLCMQSGSPAKHDHHPFKLRKFDGAGRCASHGGGGEGRGS